MIQILDLKFEKSLQFITLITLFVFFKIKVIRINGWFMLIYYGLITFQMIQANDFSKGLSVELKSPIISSPLRPKVGDNVTLACQIGNLKNQEVSWHYVDNKILLTNQNEVIIQDDRISVNHSKSGDLSTWYLIINNVSVEDSGYYLCQVKSNPPKKLLKFLDIIVPPEFDKHVFNSETILNVKEYGNVSVPCKAYGNPKPKITWRKEGSETILTEQKAIILDDMLIFNQIDRFSSGIYVCSASNQIGPSISRRIIINVQFPPIIIISNKLISAKLDENFTIDCVVESNPTAHLIWINPKKYKIQNEERDDQYFIDAIKSNNFRMNHKLTVLNAKFDYSGQYLCQAENDFGKTISTIIVNVSNVIHSTESILTSYQYEYEDEFVITTPKSMEPLINNQNKNKMTNLNSMEQRHLNCCYLRTEDRLIYILNLIFFLLIK